MPVNDREILAYVAFEIVQQPLPYIQAVYGKDGLPAQSVQSCGAPMNRQSSIHVRGANRLLGLLPKEDQQRLAGILEPVHLGRRESVYAADTPIPYACAALPPAL
jgi:hypothetical protein